LLIVDDECFGFDIDITCTGSTSVL